MKRILIIHAHPEPNSFCAALKQTTLQYYAAQGDKVDVIDLYKIKFDPVGGKNDFTSLSNPDYFKYQLEQVHAYENDLFSDDLKEHMRLLDECDIMIFNFPLWWFGLPAILKGWVDRVFAMGFVYGNGKGVYDNGVYRNKVAFASLTTGGPEMAYGDGKNGNIHQILYPINHGIFYFAGMQVIEPFISYSPVRKSDEERSSELKRLQSYLSKVETAPRIY